MPTSEPVATPDDAAEHIRLFITAAIEGAATLVTTMLDADPSLVRQHGPHPYWGGKPTALQVAVEWGRTDVVRLLLERGADPNGGAALYDGWTPLHLAINGRRDDLRELLIERGAATDIWSAASTGDEATVAAFLAADPSLALARGPNDATPLHFAGTEAVARQLVEAGALLDARDQYRMTPLRAAAYAGARRRDAARYLAKLSTQHDLFLATALGDTAQIAAMLDAEPTLVHATDAHGEGAAVTGGGTALHLAASLDARDAASLLLTRGADVRARSSKGHLPLHYAAKEDNVEVAELLIAAGANPADRDDEHQGTALDWARFFERASMLTFLESRA